MVVIQLMKKYGQSPAQDDKLTSTLTCYKNLVFHENTKKTKKIALISPNSQFLLLDDELWDVSSKKLIKFFEFIVLVVEPSFSFNSKYLILLEKAERICVSNLQENQYQFLQMQSIVSCLQFHFHKLEFLIGHFKGIEVFQISVADFNIVQVLKLQNGKEEDSMSIYQYSKQRNQIYCLEMTKLSILCNSYMKTSKMWYCQESFENVIDSLSKNCLLISTNYGSIYIVDSVQMHMIKQIHLRSLSLNLITQYNGLDILIQVNKKGNPNRGFSVLSVTQLLPELKILKDNILIKHEKKQDIQIFLQPTRQIIVYYQKGRGQILEW